MPCGGPSWLGVSTEFDAKSPPGSSRQLQWRPYFFSLQRQQERGRKATIVGSLLQSSAAADYQMIQCSHCNQWYHVNCTDVPKTVLNNNKARWLCEFNFVSSSNIWVVLGYWYCIPLGLLNPVSWVSYWYQIISMYIKICGETLDPGKHVSLLAMCQLC